MEALYQQATDLLRKLIAVPSFSKEEGATASLLTEWLHERGIEARRSGNNIIALNHHFDEAKPTILINSHHDTVKPAKGYTRNPFAADVEDGKLFGLGSNDAGGCLVSLMAAFVYFKDQQDLPFNLVLAATAEEEISGVNGISSVIDSLGAVAGAIVGEPTLMQMAVAERGLMVCDCVATGQSGHAARKEGVNALYKAVKDIAWLQESRFERISPFLGPVSTTATSIETENKAHNVVPDNCSFVLDIRLNELYTHEEVLQILQHNMQSSVKARSMRLRSSVISQEHPLVVAGQALGMTSYGSPTLSDKALMPFPALKLGPGDSARSHTADEFIYLAEIEQGIKGYIALLEQVKFQPLGFTLNTTL